MDRVGDFLAEKTPRRIIALATFIGIVIVFRPLLPLLIFFVTFERLLAAGTELLQRRFQMKHNIALMLLILVSLGILGITATLEIGRGIRGIGHMREMFPERLAAMKESPLFVSVSEKLGNIERIAETAKHYAGNALAAAAGFGHMLVYVIIGFILAVVYRLEEDHLRAFQKGFSEWSLRGTLLRWMGYLADAVVVTVQLQVIVAICNAVLTLPVLLLLHVHHIPMLMVLIFVSSLVPVIGNLVAGVVLSLMAYESRGWLGVGVLVVLTAVLHKIESYYLNPRLTARHVNLPGFVIILSLIACEHLLGFVGLFVSFPLLFVAGKIQRDFVEGIDERGE